MFVYKEGHAWENSEKLFEMYFTPLCIIYMLLELMDATKQ